MGVSKQSGKSVAPAFRFKYRPRRWIKLASHAFYDYVYTPVFLPYRRRRKGRHRGADGNVKLLVFGNDPTVNEFDFENISDEFVTVGVNRIWKKFVPDYFYFMDFDILVELDAQNIPPSTFKTVIAPLWVIRRVPIEGRMEVLRLLQKYNVVLVDDAKYGPSSVLWAMRTLQKEYFADKFCEFYIVGVSLVWDSQNHHFWGGDSTVLNRLGGDWYGVRFDLQFRKFRRFYMRVREADCFVVNPESRLAKVFTLVPSSDLKPSSRHSGAGLE